MKHRNHHWRTSNKSSYILEKKEEILKLSNDTSGNLSFFIAKQSDKNKYQPLFNLQNFELIFKLEEDCGTNIRNRKYY